MNRYTQSQLASRIEMSHNHFTHPWFLFGKRQPFGPQYPFLNQYICSCLLTLVAGTIFYGICSGLSYLFFYVIKKSKYVPLRQERKQYQEKKMDDVKWSLLNIVGQTPLVTLIKMGYAPYSKIQYEWPQLHILAIYLMFHILYDQFLTYWAHRLLHHPIIFRRLHQVHHRSKAITPFSGFAFHPVDAFLQAVPSLTSCYFIPLPLDLVLIWIVGTGIWSISIHDNINMVPFKAILYAGSHSIHHKPWGENFNYGKFTSICDRLYGTYCDPEGITGYGYELSAKATTIYQTLNNCFTKLVPDKLTTDQRTIKDSIQLRKVLLSKYGCHLQ